MLKFVKSYAIKEILKTNQSKNEVTGSRPIPVNKEAVNKYDSHNKTNTLQLNNVG